MQTSSSRACLCLENRTEQRGRTEEERRQRQTRYEAAVGTCGSAPKNALLLLVLREYITSAYVCMYTVKKRGVCVRSNYPDRNREGSGPHTHTQILTRRDRLAVTTSLLPAVKKKTNWRSTCHACQG